MTRPDIEMLEKFYTEKGTIWYAIDILAVIAYVRKLERHINLEPARWEQWERDQGWNPKTAPRGSE